MYQWFDCHLPVCSGFTGWGQNGLTLIYIFSKLFIFFIHLLKYCMHARKQNGAFKNNTVKPVLSGHLKIDKTKVLMENGSLMKIESIAKCSRWSILQYFRPSLSDNRYSKTIFVFFLSGRLRQVLLYKLAGI